MTAADFIAGFERFSAHTYWDVNAFRLGFGSDTEGPEQIRVTNGMVTTEERALQNLALRISKFQTETILNKHVGIETWNNLTDNQRSAITSVVYNYGRLPSRVVIDLNDPEKTAASIRSLQTDNGGVNHSRRNKEADLYLTGAGLPHPASPARIPEAPVHVPGLPTPPAAPPSIHVSWAARLAIELDQLISLQAAYRAEFPTPFDGAIAELQKLGTAPQPSSQPRLSQKPVVNPAAQPQRNPIMNPQILATVRSVLLALGGAAVSKGVVDESTMTALVGGAVAAASFGWSLWGHSKTSIIAAAASLPEVQKVVTTPAIADSPKFAANNRVVAH